MRFICSNLSSRHSQRGSSVAAVLAVTVAIIGAFVFGVQTGYENQPPVAMVYGVANKVEAQPEMVDFSPFWRAWQVIDEKYVARDSADNQARVWGAIDGLARSLGDPYTVFFPPEEFSIFQESITGNFEGVGMEVGMRDDVITVIAPLVGTPAESAGVEPGDKIVQIDGEPTVNMTLERAVTKIRGEQGTAVELVVVREGETEPLTISITREVIHIPTLETSVQKGDTKVSGDSAPAKRGELREGVFIIRLFNFNQGVENEFSEALREFIHSGSNKLVLDLRGNPGGFLNAAVDVASWFLPKGKVVVTEELAGGAEGDVYRSKGYNMLKSIEGGAEVVILVNGGSASASEIVAGALQEHGGATIVGEQTFGKGSVQELVEITPGTALKITIARWLTPNGNSIDKDGITPDVIVKMTREQFEEEGDVQLEKAIRLLNGEHAADLASD